MTTRHETAETAETMVRRQIDRLCEAMAAKDLAALKALYTTDVVSFDVLPPLQHVGAEAKLTKPARAFADFRELVYEVRDLTVTADDEVAYAHGFGRVSGTLVDGTRSDGIWVRDTFCFRRIDGDWLIAHDHVSLPMDPADGGSATGLAPGEDGADGAAHEASSPADAGLAAEPAAYWTRLAYEAVISFTREQQVARGFTQPQYWILRNLSKNDVSPDGQGMTIPALEEAMSAYLREEDDLAAEAAILLDRGWLSRDGEDRMWITEEGERGRVALKGHAPAIRAMIHEGIDDADYVTAVKVLQRLIRNTGGTSA